MVKTILKDAEKQMKKTVDHTESEFASLRTGRASTNLLKHIQVDYYGVSTPLEQIAKVTIPEARLLVVQPWEKTMVPIIEKAILEANLGLNPINNGEFIRVPIPALTKERRQELVKLSHRMAENGRIAIRNIRKEGNHKVKEMENQNKLSQDEASGGYDDVQKLTNDFIKNIEKLLSGKEQDIMED